MIDHVSIQVRDVHASADFYHVVLAPLGGRRVMEFSEVIGYGTTRPVFWLGPTETAGEAREVHLAFAAADRSPPVSRWSSAAPGRPRPMSRLRRRRR